MPSFALSARLLGAACLLFAASGSAAPPLDGTLDTAFLNGGRRTVEFDINPALPIDVARKVVVDAAGRSYLVGTAAGTDGDRIAISRLTREGVLDATYGNGGRTLSPPGARMIGMSAVLDGEGHLLVAGYQELSGTDTDFLVCRFDPTGQLVSFPGHPAQFACITIPFDLGGTLRDTASAIALDGQGRIVLAGNAGLSTDVIRAGVVRLMPDGLPDFSFGDAGRFHFLADGHGRHRIHDLLVQANGKIYLIGETRLAGQVPRRGLVARVTGDGALDAGFGGSGVRAYIHLDGSRDTYFLSGRLHRASAVDSSLTVVGATENIAGSGQYSGMVTRIVPGGNVQGSFGNSGNAVYGSGGNGSIVFSGLIEHADHRMVAVGTQSPGGNVPSDFIAIGMRADGLPDLQGFNAPSGRLSIDFGTAGGQDTAHAAAVGDNRIFIAGAALWAGPNDLDFAVAVLHQDRIFANGLQAGN